MVIFRVINCDFVILIFVLVFINAFKRNQLLHAETYLHLLTSLKRFGLFKNLTWKRRGIDKRLDTR